MPHAVTHFLIPAILTAIFRDIYLRKNKDKRKKHKREFPLHYVLIAGLAGLLPDFDIAVYYILSFFGFTINQIHRTFSHTLLFFLAFLIIGFIFLIFHTKNHELGKHKLKLFLIFFVISFGILTHLILDATLMGKIMPFYPISNSYIALDLLKKIPKQFQQTIMPTIDAIILIFWMIYIELKHKISDFI